MKHLSIIFALLFISFPSFADFSSSQCSSLHAGDDFSVWFKLAPSSGEDTIYTTKRNGGSPTPIWSNNSSVQSPVIDDNETSNGEFYEVWLEYQSVTNKSGWLTYNLWEGSSWRQVGTRQYADLSGLSSAIAVSGDGASEIKCDDDITEPPPSYSPQALYQFGVMQCNGSECKIPLNKPFTNTPLVFVMPTIDPSNPDSDAPATLVVTNVTKTEATIEQIKAPKNGGGSDLTSQPMTEVSYLAIEPGVADFNGHEVIAGYLDTNRYKSKNGTNGNAESVAYSTFGAQQAFNSPVVLHQLQTRNNGSRWVTSGKLIGGNDNNEARLFLELSASRVGNNYQEERVGFIATNSTSGATLEVDGYKVQFARGYDTPSQNGNDPMLDGCEDKFATISLTNIDGIIANKQERAGGHGGWLRRCNINNDQVSFAVDEDFRDRTHIPEEVGYFAFELEDVPLDICDIAPYAVQSWSNNSSLIWTSNTASIQIEGTYQSSGQVGIWVDPTNPTVDPKAQCDGKECVENSSLYVAEPNIVDLDLPIGQNVDAGWQNIELSSGKYNTVSAGGSGTINLTGDTYYIEHLIVGASGKIILSQDTKIYVNSFELSGTGLVINNDFKLSIWAENYKGHSASVQVERNLNALIFSRDKVLVTGGNGLINGRVTAKHIELRPDGKIIDDGQFCPVQPSDYQLSLTPNKDFSLLCETPQVTVTVTDTQGNPATEQVEVYITTPAGMTVSSVTEGSYNGGASYSTSSSGILTLELDADSIGTYKIEAELASDSNQNDSGDFLVSLYKLEASDVYAIAGKDAEFTLKVLACKNDSVTPVSGYSGSKNLDISQFTLLKPSLREGAQDGGLLVSGDGGITWSNSSTTFDFTDAQATPNGKLNYDESGSVSFKLSDPDFECPTGYDCEDNEGGDLDALEGVVNVFVRPWKIAICDIKETSVTTNSNPATTTGSPGFMASGENFSVKYRPIVFGSGDECNLDVTTNYARDSGPINVSFKLAYPNIVDDDLNITPAVVGPFDNFSELVISNYLWDEVGSVQFKTSATYLTMDLNEDTELVGRFYPKYFTTIGTPLPG
jgi:MSHA biogenesis protein MshQ